MNALVNLAQTVLEALLFFRPAMWWVSRQVRKERENCCDDIAVAVSGNRECYVQALTRLEEQRAASSVAALAATGGSLLDRARRRPGQPGTEFGYRSATAWLAGLVAVGFVSLALATGEAPQQEGGEGAVGAEAVAAAGRIKERLNGPESEPLKRFLEVERFARLPEAERARQLPRFYKNLDLQTISPRVEIILSTAPNHILHGHQESGPVVGNTKLWGEQLAEAASELSAEQVADKLRSRVWLNVAIRARILDVFRSHEKILMGLLAEDLQSFWRGPVNRATSVIAALKLRSLTDRLLEMFLGDGRHAKSTYLALVNVSDPAVVPLLLEEVKKDPSLIVRCSELFRVPLAGKEPEPGLLKLLDSPDVEARYHAAFALQECSDTPAAELTLRLAGDAEARVRFIAAYRAAKLAEEDFRAIRKQLLPLLEDQDDEVRCYILPAFARDKDPAAGSAILDLLRRDQLDESCRATVLQAMSVLTGSTGDYDAANWGADKPGNREAIERFEAWLKGQENGDAVPAGGGGVESPLLRPPVRVEDAVYFLDGGTIAVELADSVSKHLSVCFDGRMENIQTRGKLFIGRHPDDEGARGATSDEEREIVAALRSWVDANPYAGRRKKLLDRALVRWGFRDFQGVTAITFHNDLGEERIVKMTKSEDIQQLILAIKLTPKEPCACEHMWSATFHKQGAETKVAICDHCFDIQGTGAAKHFSMSPEFFRLFAKHTGWPDKGVGGDAAGGDRNALIKPPVQVGDIGIIPDGEPFKATGAPGIDSDPVPKQILPILQAMKQEVVKLGEEYPQLAGAKMIDVIPGEWLFEHDCRYTGKRGYEYTGPFPVAIGLRVITTERFAEQMGMVEMSYTGYRWEYLGLVGWPTLHVGEGVPPVVTGKLQQVLSNAMAKIGPLNRKALADSLPEEIQLERDRLLAEADAKIRSGIRKLAETYPLLKNGQSWDRLKMASDPGCIGIHVHRTQVGKGRTDAREFPPSEAFSILVVVKPPPDEIEQLAIMPLYPRLGLVGQVGSRAANPDLDAALKKLVTEALAPLRELEERVERKKGGGASAAPVTPDYRRGQAEAMADLRAGRPRYFHIGEPLSADSLLVRTLRNDYGLTLVSLGRTPVPAVGEHAKGYNETVSRALILKSGRDSINIKKAPEKDSALPEQVRKPEISVEKAGFKFDAGFIPEKSEIMVGEAIYATFYVRNTGTEPIYLETGGDGRSIRSYRFRFSATDEQGNPARDSNPNPGHFGGLQGPPSEITPGGTYSEKLELAKWLSFDRPGDYTVGCARTLQFPAKPEFTQNYALVHPLVTSFRLKVVPRSEQGLAARIAELGKQLRGEVDENEARLTARLLVETDDARIIPDLLWAAEKWSGDSWALRDLSPFKDDPRVIALYRGALRESRGNSRRSDAARLMGESQNKEFVPDLLQAFGKEEDKIVLTSVASALGKFGDQLAVPVLQKHRDHAYPYLRLAIEQALAECGEALDVERLQAMIRSTDPSWHSVARFVSANAGAVAPRVLAECLDYEHPEAAVDRDHINASPAYRNGTLLMCIAKAGGPQFNYNQIHNRPATAAETEVNRQTLRKVKEWLAIEPGGE
ncbi:MAG: HEAT repeat domain-containing protein [Akkermansiaceae bacterium]|nr:HEAT repeat domain-containing protein [Akkermansiaceae bacterium]